MRIEGKPIIAMQATLTLDQVELEMIGRLCNHEPQIIDAIFGKNALPDKTEAMRKFFRSLNGATAESRRLFADANAVLTGEKTAIDTQTMIEDKDRWESR